MKKEVHEFFTLCGMAKTIPLILHLYDKGEAIREYIQDEMRAATGGGSRGTIGDRLKELEEEGYIKSEIYDHARKWRKYALTDRGKRMAEKILKIMEIIET